MHPVLERIRTIGLVPVIKLTDPESALPLGKALIAGGIPVAEITFRTAAAAEAIRRLSSGLPELLVGAGTVLTTEQARIAAEAGAGFIVTPALNPDVVAAAKDLGVPILPGVSGPDGVDLALRLGLEAVKLFPAEAVGGLRLLDALAGPYASMSFVPTGGIDAGNAGEYLTRKNVLAVGGTWMASAALIEAADWAGIESRCAAGSLAIQGFSFSGVGVTEASDEAAGAKAALLEAALGMKFLESDVSFSSGGIEICKRPQGAWKGYIGIKVNDVGRALAWLASKGIEAAPGTERRHGAGLSSAYLKLDIGGLPIRLIG